MEVTSATDRCTKPPRECTNSTCSRSLLSDRNVDPQAGMHFQVVCDVPADVAGSPP